MKKLVGRDRVAVIASQLSEFLDRYERELALPPNHQHYGECEMQLRDCTVVVSNVFDTFLRVARSDLPPPPPHFHSICFFSLCSRCG